MLALPSRRSLLSAVALGFVVASRPAAAARSPADPGDSLYTSSVTYCAPTTGILVSAFSFQYYAQNNSAYFTLSAASVSSDLNLTADVSIDIYGMSPINYTINLCSIADGVLCPLPMVNFTGGSALPVPSDITSQIPSIAYSVPDLEAYAQLQFRDVDSGKLIACIEATLSNGWSAKQPAVAWCTAMMALLAVLVSWVHTAVYVSRFDRTLGASPNLVTDSSSPAQWRVVDVVLLFQTIAASGLLTLQYPTVYSSFVLNFRWALGLFYVGSIQDAIDSARAKTGGKMSSSAYPDTQYVNRKLNYSLPIGTPSTSTQSVPSVFSGYVIPQANSTADLFDLDHEMYRRAPSVLLDEAPRLITAAQAPKEANAAVTTHIPAGIPVYVNSLNIPVANAFFTVFFIWLFLVLVFLAIHALFWVALRIATRKGRREARADGSKVEPAGWQYRLQEHFGLFAISNALRMTLMVTFPIFIFCLHQFTLKDAWLPIFLAVLLLLFTIGSLLFAEGTLLLAARRSNHFSTKKPNAPDPSPEIVDPRTPTSTLSGSTRVASPSLRSMWSPFPTLRPMASALYQQYRSPMHSFWLVPLAFAVFAKSCFISFGQGHGHAQVIGLVVIEGLIFIALVALRPHTTKKGDWLSATLSLFRLVATGLLISFFPSLGANEITKTVLGIVIVAVWGFAVLLLFFSLLYNLFWGVFWQRHIPQTPADDDESLAAAADGRDPFNVVLEEPRTSFSMNQKPLLASSGDPSSRAISEISFPNGSSSAAGPTAHSSDGNDNVIASSSGPRSPTPGFLDAELHQPAYEGRGGVGQRH